jgi:hypothetical protein
MLEVLRPIAGRAPMRGRGGTRRYFENGSPKRAHAERGSKMPSGPLTMAVYRPAPMPPFGASDSMARECDHHLAD